MAREILRLNKQEGRRENKIRCSSNKVKTEWFTGAQKNPMVFANVPAPIVATARKKQHG